MNLSKDSDNSYFLRRFVFLILIMASSACVGRVVDELTSTSPYADAVGTEYRVIAEVDAYGIYENLDKKVISYITLIPGVGISGPEVAFKKKIARGQRVKILSAWKEHRLLHSDVYYLIAFENMDLELPHDTPIRIELSRGNEGVGVGLNPRIYERLAK